MSITGITNAAAEQAAGTQAGAQQTLEGQEFETLLRPLQENTQAAAPEATAKAGGEKGLEFEMLDRAQVDYERFKQVLQRIHSEGPFSPQELLALQAEVYQITLQLYTTTSAVSESVSDVKLIFQQQI